MTLENPLPGKLFQMMIFARRQMSLDLGSLERYEEKLGQRNEKQKKADKEIGWQTRRYDYDPQTEETEKNARIAETREIYKNTGILECLEEIRDNHQLTFIKHDVSSEGNNIVFIRGRQIKPEIITTPAIIKYNFNEVILFYDGFKQEAEENEIDEYNCNKLSVEEIGDNNFALKMHYVKGELEEKIGSARETVDGINLFIERNEHPGNNCESSVTFETLTKLAVILDQ